MNNQQTPTDYELDVFIVDWLSEKRHKLGAEFLTEAVSEATSVQLIPLTIAYESRNSLELGIAFRELVENYWTPKAIYAANLHNFEEDRQEAYGGDK